MEKKIMINNKCTTKLVLLIGLLLVVCFTGVTPVLAIVPFKRVLYISSYSESFLSVPEQIEGIRSIFASHPIALDMEYMDTKRFDNKENIELFHQLLQYKLSQVDPYDAIIIGDDNALSFAMEHTELFDDIPMVFLGINDVGRAKRAHDTGRFTGVIEQAPVKENIEIARKLQPEAIKIIAIVDGSLTGQGDREQFYAQEAAFPGLAFHDINASDYLFAELGVLIEAIDTDTILLFMSLYTDKSGRSISIDQGVSLLVKHSKVPIYRQSIGGVGDGVFGGRMVSFVESGKIVAEMVMKLLDGVPLREVPMVLDSPNRYMFDYLLMRKYGIDEKLMPVDAIFVNKQITFYEEHRTMINRALAVIFFFMGLSVLLYFDVLKRKRMEKQLIESLDKIEQSNADLMVSEEEIRVQYESIQERIEEIELLNQRFEIAVEVGDTAVWEMDLSSNLLFLSNSFANLIESPFDYQLTGKDFLDQYVVDQDRKLLNAEFQACLEGRSKGMCIQIQLRVSNDRTKWVTIKGKGLYDSKENLKLIHGIIQDITKDKDQAAHIEYLAYYDFLTELPNRMSFLTDLDLMIKQDIPCAVLLLDIDDFKRINDTIGHSLGDRLLIEVAGKLVSITSEALKVARFSGDEFLILLRNVVEKEEIEYYLNLIHQALSCKFQIEQHEVFIHVSIGITLVPFDSKDIDEIIMNADTAMYHAKRTGKNKVSYYHVLLKEELLQDREMEEILRKAIAEDGFKLVYQPIVSVATTEIQGFEALVRLKDHNISPAKFIRVAEENGLIIELGRWVTEAAIKQLMLWKEKGLIGKPVSINFSIKQIYDSGYMQFLEDMLAQYQVDPCLLGIEITEGLLVENRKYVIDFLYELKRLGISLALDDFGTGYSSLNYLTYIPVDKVKLDKSLCDKFLSFDDSQVMHSLDLRIVAEGIETMEQYDRLKIEGCDYIQGFLFSKPLSVLDAEAVYYTNLMDQHQKEVLQ